MFCVAKLISVSLVDLSNWTGHRSSDLPREKLQWLLWWRSPFSPAYRSHFMPSAQQQYDSNSRKAVCDYGMKGVWRCGTEAVRVKCCTNEAERYVRERLVSNVTTQLSHFQSRCIFVVKVVHLCNTEQLISKNVTLHASQVAVTHPLPCRS